MAVIIRTHTLEHSTQYYEIKKYYEDEDFSEERDLRTPQKQGMVFGVLDTDFH